MGRFVCEDERGRTFGGNSPKSTKIGRNQRELECVCAFLIDLAWAQANLRGQSRAKERF